MTEKGLAIGYMSKGDTTSPFFLSMTLGHEQVISDLKQAALDNSKSYGEAKKWLDDQIDLVPQGRSIRRDDCETFYGLVKRAKGLIQQEQDKLEINND